MEDVYDLSRPSHELLQLAIKFADYEKLQGLIVLKALSLPTLDTFLISHWASGTRRRIKAMLDGRGWTAVMLRSDCARQAYNKPRGGHIFAGQPLYSSIQDTIAEGRLVFLSEPIANRFRNLYNGNVCFDPADDYLYWEIVGPGFDMSDINRGDATPHEIFQTSRGKDVEDWRNLSPLDVRGRNMISEGDYRRSWTNRMLKVGMMAPTEYANIKDPLERAEIFLREANHPLLLKSKDCYRPMGYEMRCKIFSLIANLPEKLKRHGFHGEPFAVSFGVLQGRGLIFWDIFYPFTYTKT